MRPGDVFGPYQVVKLLGRGAMGEVALVQHTQLGALYALKVLGRALAQDQGAQQRFQREMAALAQVDAHPGVVRVHASGLLPDGRPYFVMEYVEGQTLARALRHGLTAELGIEVVLEIAEALGFLHQHGIVHRDVKPENVLIAAEGRARLSDFGLAKAIGGNEQRLTLTGEMIGTPAYMSPEQASGTGSVGAYTDVFACGVVLYEVLSGSVPYKGATGLEVCMQVAEGKPFPTPSSLRAGVDPRVEAVCLKALAHKPDERYPDGNALADALREAVAEEATSARDLTKPALAVGALLVVLALAAVGYVALQREAPASPTLTAEQLPPELETLEAHAEAGNWQAILDLREQAAGWTGAAQARWAELSTQARRALILSAWDDLHLEAGLAAWDAGPPLEEPAAAWLLALAGRAADAPLAAIEDPRERAWLAAWASKTSDCEAALETLSPPRAALLGWELYGALPALGALEVLEIPEGDTPELNLARSVRAFARGRLGLAAARLPGSEELSSTELAATREVVAARLALAWGDTGPLRDLVKSKLARRAEGFDRFESWILARELAAWVDSERREALLQTLPAALRDVLQPWALDTGGRLALARAEVRARSADARAALVRAGAAPLVASHSPALAELDACRRGLDGAIGIQLARAADALAAAEAGGRRGELLERAEGWLHALRYSRAESPAYALVSLRLERLRAPPDEDAYTTFEALSPGDPAGLYELAMGREAWASWSIDDDCTRTPVGFAEAAAAWERVELASPTQAEASHARLRRVQALTNEAAEEPPESERWATIRALLAPRVEALPIADAAATRRELWLALADQDMDRFEELARRLLRHAKGLTPDDRLAIYLSAALGDVDAADAYTALVGDAVACGLLEFRAVEARGGDERAAAEELSDTLGLPLAHLVVAKLSVDEARQPSPSPLHLAAVISKGPEEVPSVVALLRDPANAPPDVSKRLEEISASGLGAHRQLLARALLYAARDIKTTPEPGRPWSLAAADALGEALEDDPAHAGLRQLRAAVLLLPNGDLPDKPLLERAIRLDLELAQAALPWAIGVAQERLRLEDDPQRFQQQVDELGAKGWFWSEDLLARRVLGAATGPWPESIEAANPWDLGTLVKLPSDVQKAGYRRTAAGLLLLFYDYDDNRRAPEENRDPLKTYFESLAQAEPDPLHRRALVEAWLTQHAETVRDREARREERMPLIRSYARAPQLAIRPPAPVGLAPSPSLDGIQALRRPHLTALWAQELSLHMGWGRAYHRAELWDDLIDDERDYADSVYTPAQLCDPWSRTRAILEGLHEAVPAYRVAQLNTLRRYGSFSRWALAQLQAAAFDRESSPAENFSDRLYWERQGWRWQRESRDERAQIARLRAGLCAYFERFEQPYFRGLRVDFLLEAVHDFDRAHDDDEPATPEQQAQRDRDWEAALKLGMELDPEQVSRDRESRAVSWYRQARCAALAGDRELMTEALGKLRVAQQNDEDEGLEPLLEREPWDDELRKIPGMLSLFE